MSEIAAQAHPHLGVRVPALLRMVGVQDLLKSHFRGHVTNVEIRWSAGAHGHAVIGVHADRVMAPQEALPGPVAADIPQRGSVSSDFLTPGRWRAPPAG